MKNIKVRQGNILTKSTKKEQTGKPLIRKSRVRIAAEDCIFINQAYLNGMKAEDAISLYETGVRWAINQAAELAVKKGQSWGFRCLDRAHEIAEAIRALPDEDVKSTREDPFTPNGGN